MVEITSYTSHVRVGCLLDPSYNTGSLPNGKKNSAGYVNGKSKSQYGTIATLTFEEKIRHYSFYASVEL